LAAPQTVHGLREGYPGGSVLLVSNTDPAHSTRLHVDINKLTAVPPPSSYVSYFSKIQFHYFLHTNENKVVCHTFYDDEGLSPAGEPFTKEKPFMLGQKKKSMSIASILCIIRA